MGRAVSGRPASVRRAAAAGTLALTVLLSGCSVFQIRTEDKSSGPMRIGVQETAGPEPTGTPTEAGIPEGMTKTSVTFGGSCPVELSFALGDDWRDSSGSTDQFHVFTHGNDSSRADIILVNCTDEYGDSAQEVVDSKRRYNFSEQDSQVLAEQTGSLAAGEYWSYQGEVGPTEILALNSKPTYAFGVQTGYKINGRLVNLSIEMRTPKTNTEVAEDFKKMLPTVTIDGERVPAPSFR
ncbi:hypothetical protein [Brevibacterium linens]|uniref:hypothetical protein n=1 Tax=Brevibacterium linens TaxID=1703 RepID=UPI000FCB2BC0|nr:hypothetical protein [Brevibacterium linens]AZU02041.1 hypothetical protein CXR29_16250 [Brevibacterium linens]